MVLPITVVVPTYRPTVATVEAVTALSGVVEQVLVSDDASPCTFDATLLQFAPLARVVTHRDNAGIARALNEGLRAAEDAGHAWLLTMDQDSRVDSDYVHELVTAASELSARQPKIGVVAPQFVDVGTGTVSYPEASDGVVITTHEVFQSGALWNVAAIRECGGFDEDLAMDAVDAAACLRLRERGYQVALAPGLVLDHSWGQAEFINFGGRSVALTHHSPERRRTMVRNRLRLAPAEFRQSPTHGFRTLRRLAVGTVLALTQETRRREKFAATLAGIHGATKR